MKGYFPLKRHQALVSLSRDHHFGLLLVWKIKQGLANAIVADRISDYVLYFFDTDLQHHFKEEEQMLFPMLADDNALRQQAESEHAAIYKMIDRLRHDKTNERLLLQFSEMLKKHIRFEERELFAYMQETFSEWELETIARHEENSGRVIDAGWPDASDPVPDTVDPACCRSSVGVVALTLTHCNRRLPHGET